MIFVYCLGHTGVKALRYMPMLEDSKRYNYQDQEYLGGTLMFLVLAIATPHLVSLEPE